MAQARDTERAPHDWDAQLRARGYRATPQRQLVLEALATLRHATPEDVGARVQQAEDAAHVRLVCRACGKITEISPDVARPLVATLDAEQGFETDVGHLTVFGRCPDCRRAAPWGPGRPAAARGLGR